MKKIIGIVLLLIIVLSTIVLSGCDDIDSVAQSTFDAESATDTSVAEQTNMSDQMNVSKNSVGVEMRRSETIQLNLDKTQPQPNITWSLERDNIINRVLLWNNPYKVSYIYIYNNTGIILYDIVQGKISSVNSTLSTPTQIVDDPNTNYDSAGSLILESPQEDGSYGTNGDGYFYFNVYGAYREFNGDYILSDEPFNLSIEPFMQSIDITSSEVQDQIEQLEKQAEEWSESTEEDLDNMTDDELLDATGLDDSDDDVDVEAGVDVDLLDGLN